MNGKKFPGIILIVLSSYALGTEIDSTHDKPIYLQRNAWNFPHFIQGEREYPAGRAFENLVPIMQEYPLAYKEVTEGVNLFRRANRFGWIYTGLLLLNQPILEQFMQQNKDQYLIPAGILLYGGLGISIYVMLDSSRKGMNRIHKAIWYYNKAVLENRN